MVENGMEEIGEGMEEGGLFLRQEGRYLLFLLLPLLVVGDGEGSAFV